MQERVHRSSVSFRHPFTLTGEDRVQPAGTYDVETVEELLSNVSFLAYRRVSTMITLHGPGHSWQLLEIDPTELAAALAKDAEDHHGQP